MVKGRDGVGCALTGPSRGGGRPGLGLPQWERPDGPGDVAWTLGEFTGSPASRAL